MTAVVSNTVPVGSADVLPRLAATTWPDRVALRVGATTVTFAELDRRVSRLAFGLRQLVGGDGLPVLVAAGVGLAFPTAFFAVLRSGNVAVPVNPRMPAEPFAGLLADAGARVALVGRAMYERVRGVLAGAGLEQVVLLDAPAETGQPTAAGLAALGDLLVEPRDRAETTDALPGRSHLDLKSRAAGLAAADGLDSASVVLTASSGYDPVYLAAALTGGATQVLWGNPDPAALRRAAAGVGATHVYRGAGAERLAVAS